MTRPYGQQIVYVTKKYDPIVLNDYAKVGSAYSRFKVKMPKSVWDAYEEYREKYFKLDAQVSQERAKGGYCPEWLMDAYEEARELFFQAHLMFEDRFIGTSRAKSKEE